MTRGRPRRYAEYEALLEKYPAKSMSKRPVYVKNIGVFRGKSGDTAYLKIALAHGGTIKNKTYQAGQQVEIAIGKLSSWSWEQLEAERNRIQGLADRGEKLEETSSIGFDAYAKIWLQIASKRQKSFDTTNIIVKNTLIPKFGKKSLKDINVRDINLWQALRLDSVKPATVQREKNTLKSILNAALKEGLIDKNPCDSTDKIRGIQARLRYWTKDELSSVLSAAKSDAPFHNYLLWALHSAMRRSEILNLEWIDIKHLPNGQVKVHLTTSKSDKPRQIPCNSQMQSILIDQKALSPNAKHVFGFSKKMLQRRFDRIRTKTGIQDITLHDLRTLNITYSLLAGVDAKTLTGITGHKDLQMIQKHYSIIVDEALTTASNKSGNYIQDLINTPN